jgi:hypothetical protein
MMLSYNTRASHARSRNARLHAGGGERDPRLRILKSMFSICSHIAAGDETMSEHEISLARAYLTASDQDPVAALIRSVRDLAQTRRMLASLPSMIADLYADEPSPTLRSLEAIEAAERLAA